MALRIIMHYYVGHNVVHSARIGVSTSKVKITLVGQKPYEFLLKYTDVSVSSTVLSLMYGYKNYA
jgi:hypothetical protein